MTDVVVCDFMHGVEVVAEQRRGRMKYCGIDVGGTNWVSVEDENGKIIERFEIGHNRKDFEKVESLIDKDTEICLEDTGVYSHPIFEYFKSRGYPIKRINGWRAKHLRKFMNKRIKTDPADCGVLAKVKKVEAITGETATYSSYESSSLKNCARAYWNLKSQMAKLKSKIKQIIFLICPELRENFSDSFCLSVLYLLRYFRIDELKISTPENVLERLSVFKKTVAVDMVRKLQESLDGSVGLPKHQDANFYVLTDLYLGLHESSKKLLEQMEKELLKTDYAELLNLPYIGVVIAGIIVGEIGNIDRFSNHKKFVNYCGYDFAIERSCSKNEEFMGRTGSLIRDTLSVLAMHFIKEGGDNKFKNFYTSLKARGKKPKICFNATKRKLLVWLYYEMKKAKKKGQEKGYKFESGKLLAGKGSEDPTKARIRRKRFYSRHREDILRKNRANKEQNKLYMRRWRERRRLEFEAGIKNIIS